MRVNHRGANNLNFKGFLSLSFDKPREKVMLPGLARRIYNANPDFFQISTQSNDFIDGSMLFNEHKDNSLRIITGFQHEISCMCAYFQDGSKEEKYLLLDLSKAKRKFFSSEYMPSSTEILQHDLELLEGFIFRSLLNFEQNGPNGLVK